MVSKSIHNKLPVCIIVLLALCVANCFALRRPATSAAEPFLQSTSEVSVVPLNELDGVMFVPTQGPPAFNGGPNITRGLIFIGEEGVDAQAYAPMMYNLATRGHLAIALSNNFNFGFGSRDFLSGRVVNALAENPVPTLSKWAIGGHGKGGKEASRIMTNLFPRFEGLLLVGARVDESFNLKDEFIPVVSIYGANDQIVSESQVRSDADTYLPDTTYIYGVDGANHGTFGCYHSWPFNGDGPSSINCDNAAFLDEIKQVIDLPNRFAQAYSFSAMPEVNRILEQYPNPNVTLSKVGSWYVLSPKYPNGVGLAYYPGAAVDPRAYIPMYRRIAAEGYLVVIMTVPVGFSGYAPNEAQAVIDAFPQVTTWTVGGHSAGGSTASTFAYNNPSVVKGVVLNAGGAVFDMSSYNTKVIQLYGSLDSVGGTDVTGERFRTRYEDLLPPDTIFHRIEGGNHYKWGWYGYQYVPYPDNVGTISREQQQDEAVPVTLNFLSQFV